jgi:ketosteroid isomerase-like protein
MTDPLADSAGTQYVQAVRRLYDAFVTHDAKSLLATVALDFHGLVTDGMPDGLGGGYNGAQPIFRDCWARVFALVDVRPVRAEYQPVAANGIAIRGHCVETACATGRSLSAAFTHILRVTADRVSRLVQIIDTVGWHDALAQ